MATAQVPLTIPSLSKLSTEYPRKSTLDSTVFTRSSHACSDDEIFRRGNDKRTLAIMVRTNWHNFSK